MKNIFKKNIKSISIKTMKNMFFMSNIYIQSQKNYLNEINVFPVPDWDTWSNMAYTMKWIQKTIKNKRIYNYKQFSYEVSNSAVMNSRWNSGTVLSQYILGFCDIIKNENKRISKETFINAIINWCNFANKSFEKISKWTIIDLTYDLLDFFIKNKESEKSINELLKDSLNILKNTLENTKYIREKESWKKVIDSWAAGFLCFWQGISNGIKYEDSDLFFHKHNLKWKGEKDEQYEYDKEYRYCTEVVFSTKNNFEILDIIKWWSLQTINFDWLSKIHIHTNEPNKLKDFIKKNWTLYDFKADDMRWQIDSNINTKKNKTYFDTNKKANVVFIVDEGADIKESMFLSYPILQIPLNIVDLKTQEDMSHINNDDLYKNLSNWAMYTTSQPSVKSIEDVYKKALEYSDIAIYLSLSSKVSWTYELSNRLSKNYSDKIIVIDTKIWTAWISFIIPYLSNFLEQFNWNITKELIKEKVDLFVKNIIIKFFIPDLSNLIKSWRISKQKWLLGRLFNMGFIVWINDWKVERQKTIPFVNKKKWHIYLFKNIKKEIWDAKIKQMIVLYTDQNSKKISQLLIKKIEEKYNITAHNIWLLSITKILWTHLWSWTIWYAIMV